MNVGRREKGQLMRTRACFGWCSLCSIKKLTSLKVKIVIKSCFDAANFAASYSSRENNLNSLFMWLIFVHVVLCKRLPARGDIETFFCAHFTKNGHNYSSILKSNLQHKNPQPRWMRGTIIGTISKVNQNQITSKFSNLNHLMLSTSFLLSFLCDLEI